MSNNKIPKAWIIPKGFVQVINENKRFLQKYLETSELHYLSIVSSSFYIPKT